MTPIQQLLLGAGGVKEKTYLEDVFSNYVYRGNATARSINTGIDLSGKGGLVWTKNRDQGTSFRLFDTERGVNKEIRCNSTNAEATDTGTITAFNNNGFSLGTDDATNWDAKDYASWTFRKSPMFDVVTYTGNGSNRTIAHSLKSLPGFMMVKCTSETRDWAIYHWDLNCGNPASFNPNEVYLKLNDTSAQASSASVWKNQPTATHFSVGTNDLTNKDGETYVCYLFAGGESEAATARAIDFDGSGDYLSLASSSDFAFGTGDFTIEFWVKPNSTTASQSHTVYDFRTDGGSSSQSGKSYLAVKIKDEILYRGPSNSPDIGVPHSKYPVNPGVWSHIAVVRNSSTTTIYVNGTAGGSASDSNNYTDATLLIGKNSQSTSNNLLDGEISNFRVVKGTAVYTSSFRPPTQPLTNITNTKLLCCNDSSTTGSTVTPGTITANGDPTTTINNLPVASPFRDPAAFVFGENGDQEGIKCGSYIGNGDNTGPEIFLGWEPQWILIKRVSDTENWAMFDNMRGWASGTYDKLLYPDTDGAEHAYANYIDITSTGFKIDTTWNALNGVDDDYVYVAIRRNDSYVGKPILDATKVFALDTGTQGSGNIPCFDSGFPVDFGLVRDIDTTASWFTGTRLTGEDYTYTDGTGNAAQWTALTWDSNVGFVKNQPSDYQAWMWKRHEGLDVVNFEGSEINRFIPHNLGKVPEMLWVRNRDSGNSWFVGHIGLNAGSNPWTSGYYVKLDAGTAETGNTVLWSQNHTSTHFNVGTYSGVNGSNSSMTAVLFASVPGISKVGYYTGNGAYGTNTISTGFTPRFVIIKQTDSAKDWVVLDTTRGWGSGSDKYLLLNKTDAEASYDFGAPTSTGFTLGSDDMVNGDTNKYIYYAHA